MGILDIFGGGTPEKKAQRLKAKVVQKYGDPAVRQKAIQQLGAMKAAAAVVILLQRFLVNIEPQTVDADEKEQVFQYITEMGSEAVPPVVDFFRRTEQATSWALRLLESLLPEREVMTLATEEIQRLASAYVRDPEKKTVLLQFVTGKTDERIGPAVLSLLDDHSDDVKIAALRALGPLKYEPSREPILRLLTGEETARRVQTTALAALHESGLGVQGYREKVEALIQDPYFVDKNGVVKKRG